MKRMVLRSLNEKERRSAYQEADVLRLLKHPNIVEFIDAFPTRSKLYLVRPFTVQRLVMGRPSGHLVRGAGS